MSMKDASIPPVRNLPRSERVALRELLAAGTSARLRLPADLEQEYARYHHELALGHLRTYWPLVLGAVLLICVLTFTSGVVPEDMLQLTMIGFASMFGVIGLVVVAALVERLNRHLVQVVGFSAFLGLLAMHIATLLAVDGNPMQPMAEYGVVFITVAAFSISNLPLRASMFAVVSALAGLLVVAFVAGMAPNWHHFMFYGLGSLLIGSIVGFSQEIRERTVFLQSRLLALEKQELDVLTHELSMLSRKDALTGLANRRHFDEVLAREWAACQREGAAMNLVFIDVDYFKRYNDHYGHPAGDECLRRVGEALGTQALRGADFIARYGGEEFVGMFPRTGREGLETIARRIVEAVDHLQMPHEKSDAARHVTVSVGVASITPTRSNSADDLVKAADEALYRAKGAGRHRYITSWEGAEPA